MEIRKAYRINFVRWVNPPQKSQEIHGKLRHNAFPTYTVPCNRDGSIVTLADSVEAAAKEWEDFGGGIAAIHAIGPAPERGRPHDEPQSTLAS